MRSAIQPNISIISGPLFPGRKHWFVQSAARYFGNYPCHTLVEPFAGSLVIGLSLLYAGIVERLIAVEKDPAVFCLLKGMISDRSLADRFGAFECTRENVLRVLRNETGPFRYLVLSRVSNRAKWWGGLRSEIASRWCKDVVVPNLRRVYEMRDRITVIHGDGMAVMRAHAANPAFGSFADPPYGADPSSKGHSIYRHHKLDHKKLFSLLGAWRGPWLLTEDNTPMVRRLALCHRFQTKRIRMNTSDNIVKHELAIWRKRPVF